MPKMAQDGNRFPYTLIDAPWKEVGVASKIGQGSKFYFTLPAAADNGEG